jgi:hypothetical protein
VLEAKYLHVIGAFDVCLIKVSALKLSHPSTYPVFQDFSRFSLLRHSLLKGRDLNYDRVITIFRLKFEIILRRIDDEAE